jgi:lipoate-protein ligase A
MALDQALLESAVEEGFVPALRFYRWSPPSLSIGRFQPISDVDLDTCAVKGVEVVRRPTGGKSILHLDDFTYSLVLPRSWALPRNVEAAYIVICRGIIAALATVGVEAAVQCRAGEDYRDAGGACFAVATRADLVYAGRKLCGSAQVRREGATLQHGSLFLYDRSDILFDLLRFKSSGEKREALRAYRMRCVTLEETGASVSWDELAVAFRSGFERAFGVSIPEGELTEGELRRWLELKGAYRSPRWLINAESRALPSPQTFISKAGKRRDP